MEDQSNETMSFDKMGLKENLLRGVYSYGFENPSQIQSKTIPLIAKGVDLIAQSQSGTGKTGAFTIGLLERIDDRVQGCQGIILAHTKELAQQIYEVCKHISQYTQIKTVLCIGGQDILQSKAELESGSIVVIGTPGRVIDLIKRKYLSTRLLRIFVTDEADEMFSVSFQEQLKTILNLIPNDTQICLFSATIPAQILDLTTNFMRNPEYVLMETENLTLDGIKQFMINLENEMWKFETFCDLYNIISVSQTIVYVNSIRKGVELKKQLENKHFTVSLIHSDMTVPERVSIMKEFRNGSTRILISTDLLARGIDIQQISVVINYDFPRGENGKENYLHRIGRSGRFGRKGVAINFITKNDEKNLADLQNHYKITIEPMPQQIQQFL